VNAAYDLAERARRSTWASTNGYRRHGRPRPLRRVAAPARRRRRCRPAARPPSSASSVSPTARRRRATGEGRGGRHDRADPAPAAVVGADGANAGVAREASRRRARTKIALRVRLSRDRPHALRDRRRATTPLRCDIHYRGDLSPDFYAWVFPHGETASIGTGSAHKGFGLRLRARRRELREVHGLAKAPRRSAAKARHSRSEAAEALGRRPRGAAGGRRRRRRRAGLRRGHLLRHAVRPARRRRDRRAPAPRATRRALATARRRFMKAARPGVPGSSASCSISGIPSDKRREKLRQRSAATRTSSA
jgi:hypothetical protein